MAVPRIVSESMFLERVGNRSHGPEGLEALTIAALCPGHRSDLDVTSGSRLGNGRGKLQGATGQYAAFYTVAGTTYWDNNFGLNYPFAPQP